MARSYEYFKEDIKKYLIDRFDLESTILDVGAGEGTYYNLLGDYFKNIDAVEVFKPNIDNFRLNHKYRNVYWVNIKDFKYSKYDIIIFGDIIEHLDIKDAQKVLEYALKRCKEIIVAVPYQLKQGIEEDNVYEIHKQDDLTPEIMQERYPYLKLLYSNKEYGYYIKK